MFDAGTVHVGVELGGLTFFLNGWKAAAAGVARAGSAIANGIQSIVKNAAAAGDELQKMSQRTGVSVGTLSELKFAVSQTGASMSEFEESMRALTRASRDAKDGNERNVEMFQRLGISLRELHTLKPEQLFERTAAGLKAIGDTGLQAEDAMLAFGRSGTKLLPLVNSNMAALREESKRLGMTWDDVSANAAAQFNDEVDRASRAVESLWNEIGRQLMPVLQRTYTRIANLLPALTAWLNETKWIGEATVWMGGKVDEVIRWVSQNASRIGVAFATVGKGVVDTFAEVTRLVLGSARRIVDFFTIDIPNAAANGMWRVVQTIRGVVNAEGTAGAFSALMGIDHDTINKSLDEMQSAIVTIKTYAADMTAATTANAAETDTWIQGLQNSFTGYVDMVQDNVPRLITSIGDLALTAGNVPAALAQASEDAGNAVSNGLTPVVAFMDEQFAKLSDRTGRRVKGMAGTFSSSFQQMVASGKSMGDALTESIMQAVGSQAAAEGSFHFMAGLAMMFQPGMHGQGAARMAKGLALMALGTKLGGDGGEQSTGGGASGGETMPTRDTPGYDVEDREEQKQSLHLNVYGDMFDSEETENRLVELLNKAKDRNVTINYAAGVA